MALLSVKEGVQPPLINIIVAIANVAMRLTTPVEVMITAGIDGTHMPHSLHYALRAADFRTHNFADTKAKTAFITALQLELGHDYQVFLEGADTPNEHGHAEFQPK